MPECIFDHSKTFDFKPSDTKCFGPTSGEGGTPPGLGIS